MIIFAEDSKIMCIRIEWLEVNLILPSIEKLDYAIEIKGRL